MENKLYPLKFEPILKDKIWGGSKLKDVLNKKSESNTIGESWELSDVDNSCSVVTNGFLKGKSLRDLLEDNSAAIIGDKNAKIFGATFPLLIKFIDAKTDLSVQLHPNDELAKERHNSFGKTEMWYVMQAEENSNLIVDFKNKVTPEEYQKHLDDKTLLDILNFDKVKKGDSYFIEVGRVHAIGAGVLLAEIQQTSDVTYRLYDWDRVDDQGNERELHNDIALEAIDFDMPDNFRLNYSKDENKSNALASCKYFTTNYLPISNTTIAKENNKDSFIIYICTEGELTVETANGTETISKGQTLLMPADIKNYSLKADSATVLEVYV